MFRGRENVIKGGMSESQGEGGGLYGDDLDRVSRLLGKPRDLFLHKSIVNNQILLSYTTF